MSRLTRLRGILLENKKTTVISVLAILFLSAGASGLSAPQTHVEGASTKADSTVVPKTEPVVEHKTQTVEEEIAFTSTTVEDSNLDVGKNETRVLGVNGKVSHVYDVTYTNGVETGRVLSNNIVTREAEQEVIAKGTKQPQPNCPRGTYVNVYGSEVCRPYQTDSIPSGASAKCADGSFSFSQTRQGTCSHHGGVAIWY